MIFFVVVNSGVRYNLILFGFLVRLVILGLILLGEGLSVLIFVMFKGGEVIFNL